MSSLGKIFVYEKNTQNLHTYIDKLELRGFITFGTDNLYQLLAYSKQINPDVVIMNLPDDFDADKNTWDKVEESLCYNACPQIYINSQRDFAHRPSFHYYDFSSDEINEEQINDILTNIRQQKLLH